MMVHLDPVYLKVIGQWFKVRILIRVRVEKRR